MEEKPTTPEVTEAPIFQHIILLKAGGQIPLLCERIDLKINAKNEIEGLQIIKQVQGTVSLQYLDLSQVASVIVVPPQKPA
jgi:hypothetical protein